MEFHCLPLTEASAALSHTSTTMATHLILNFSVGHSKQIKSVKMSFNIYEVIILFSQYSQHTLCNQSKLLMKYAYPFFPICISWYVYSRSGVHFMCTAPSVWKGHIPSGHHATRGY